MALHEEIVKLTQYEHQLAVQELARQKAQGARKGRGGKVTASVGKKEDKKKESAYERKKRLAAEERTKMMERLAAEEERRLKEEAAAKDLEAATQDVKKAAGTEPEQHNMEWYMREKAAPDPPRPPCPVALTCIPHGCRSQRTTRRSQTCRQPWGRSTR